MKIMAMRKLKDGSMSEHVELIDVNNICFVYTEQGGRSRPAFMTTDGIEYYLPIQFNEYKKGFDDLLGFHTVDRCYSVNMGRVGYYEASKDKLFFKHKNKNNSFVYVARKYAKSIREIITKIGIEVRS